MKIFSFIVYILFISLVIIFTLPQQTRFRDKVTRRIYEQGFFIQYKNAFFFTKLVIWSLLVTSCLFFSGILFPIN